ncbi:MAG: hypothetical protein ACT4P1_03210 [Sporichthyaceae bacterium]
MTRAQFAMLTGFLIAWAWAESGFLVMLAALVAAAIGLGVTRVLDGQLDLTEVSERLARPRR